MTANEIIQFVRTRIDDATGIRVQAERDGTTPSSYRATRMEGRLEAYREILELLNLIDEEVMP